MAVGKAGPFECVLQDVFGSCRSGSEAVSGALATGSFFEGSAGIDFIKAAALVARVVENHDLCSSRVSRRNLNAFAGPRFPCGQYTYGDGPVDLLRRIDLQSSTRGSLSPGAHSKEHHTSVKCGQAPRSLFVTLIVFLWSKDFVTSGALIARISAL